MRQSGMMSNHIEDFIIKTALYTLYRIPRDTTYTAVALKSKSSTAMMTIDSTLRCVRQQSEGLPESLRATTTELQLISALLISSFRL
jgi:hypothetical protein